MENKTISFPHIGDYCYFAKSFFEKVTGLNVKIAPPITNKTLKLGSRYSPDFVCLPFKYNLGNYIEALEEGSSILFQFGGGCRYGNYAQLQEVILKDLGYNFKFHELVRNGKTSFKHVYNTFKMYNDNLTRKTLIKEGLLVLLKVILFDKSEHYYRKKVAIYFNDFKKTRYKFINDLVDQSSFFKTWKIYKKYRRKYLKIKSKKPILKIGIIGELYTSMEPFATYNLEEQLKKMDISIKRYTDASYLLLYKKLFGRIERFKSRNYLKYHIGADATYNVFRMLKLKKKKYDGVIHSKPFGCTPEVGVMPILSKISNEEDIPIMFLSFDTNESSEGLTTRLEAFIDMLIMRKEQKHEKREK